MCLFFCDDRPRLGAALHRVLAVGLLYFILCVIEGGYREKSGKLISKTDPEAAFYTLRLMTPHSLYTRKNIAGFYRVVDSTTLSNNTVNMIEQDW